jgi:F-type H+-transporting ATPase subunit delta
MNYGAISRRYARALFLYAKKHHREKEVFQESTALTQSFSRHRTLERCLGNIALHPKKKEELIEACAGGNVSEEFKQFIRLVIAKKREHLLQLICLTYQELFYREARLLDVHLTTAKELDTATTGRIVQELTRHTAQTVQLHATVNPKLIGGFVLRWDTYRLDTSVRTNLKRIQKNLTDIMN